MKTQTDNQTATAGQNAPKRETFKATYRQSLREAVEKFPLNYAWHYTGTLDTEVERVALRMFDAIDRNTFGHDSHAFRITARKLGIKPTRTAILNYWNS